MSRVGLEDLAILDDLPRLGKDGVRLVKEEIVGDLTESEVSYRHLVANDVLLRRVLSETLLDCVEPVGKELCQEGLLGSLVPLSVVFEWDFEEGTEVVLNGIDDRVNLVADLRV